MSINRTDVTVLDLFELASLTVNELNDGCFAWVQKEGCYCVLIKNTTGLVADGSNVIAPQTNGPGSGWPTSLWLRLTIGSQLYAAQATWYIDPVAGNDANNGLTSTTALASHEEIRRRIGNAIINQVTTINIMNDMDGTKPIFIYFNLGPSGRLVYNGIGTTTVFTGTWTNVTNINRGANTPFIMEDTSIPVSWTASAMINTVNSQAHRLRITSGARVGAISWGAKDLGTKQANTCNWATTTAFPPTQVVPQIGDPYICEQLTRIQEINVRLNVGNQTVQQPWLTFVDLDFRVVVGGSTTIRGVADILSGSTQPCAFFSACAIGYFGLINGNLMSGSQCRVGGSTYNHIAGTLGLTGGLILAQVTIHPGAFLQLGFDALVQGGAILVDGALTYDSFCVQNSPANTSAVMVRNGGNVFGNDALFLQAGAQQIYGASNARYGIEVFANGSFVYSSVNGPTKPSVTGTLNDTFVDNAAKAYAAIPFCSGNNNSQIVAGP